METDTCRHASLLVKLSSGRWELETWTWFLAHGNKCATTQLLWVFLVGEWLQLLNENCTAFNPASWTEVRGTMRMGYLWSVTEGWGSSCVTELLPELNCRVPDWCQRNGRKTPHIGCKSIMCVSKGKDRWQMICLPFFCHTLEHLHSHVHVLVQWSLSRNSAKLTY